MDTEPRTAAIVVHHDSLDTCERLVTYLLDDPAIERVAVIDNGRVHLGLEHDRLLVVPTTNRGYGAAMNLGINILRDWGYQQALLLTHDVIIDRSTIDSLLYALQVAGRSIVGPMVYTPAGLWSAGGTVSRWRKVLGHSSDIPATVAERAWLDGCCLAVRLDRLVTLFCEDYFMYVEDADFCMQHGRRLGPQSVAIVPSARVLQASASIASTYLLRRNRLIFLSRQRHRAHFVSHAALYVLVDIFMGRSPALALRSVVDAARLRIDLSLALRSPQHIDRGRSKQCRSASSDTVGGEHERILFP